MEINIIRKKKKTITIRVKNSNLIEVTAPLNIHENIIKNFIAEKKDWINKKVAEAKIRESKISDLEDNSFLFYLGKKYNLKIIKDFRDSIEISENNIILYTKKPNDYDYKMNLINLWYRKMGKEVFLPILRKYLNLTNKTIEKVSIKTLTRQWGSCNPTTKVINLNSEMLKKDIRFIEYVILHEIAHLTHPNHSKNFYNYIAKFMPNWKEYRELGRF